MSMPRSSVECTCVAVWFEVRKNTVADVVQNTGSIVDVLRFSIDGVDVGSGYTCGLVVCSPL